MNCCSSLLLLALVTTVSTIIPSYIKVCHRSDPEVEACIIRSIEHIKPRLVKGIPELNVPSYEPLIIPEIVLSSGPKAAKFNAVTRNLTVYGPSLFEIQSLQCNLTTNTFHFDLLLPRLSFDADYELEMVLLSVPIRGRGRLLGNFTNYQGIVRMQGKLIPRDQEEYLVFEKMKIRLMVGESQLNLQGLFDGDSILGEVTNRFLNENSRLFVEELKPPLEEALADLFTNVSNRITGVFTYRELFPE